MRILRNIYAHNRLFQAMAVAVALFAVSFAMPVLFPIAQAALIFILVIILADLLLLFNSSVRMSAKRSVPQVLSLSDENHITILLESKATVILYCLLIDEMPVQLQKRDFGERFAIDARSKKKIDYTIRPIVRGEYTFGNINLYIHSRIGFMRRRIIFPAETMVKVYPSIIQMKQNALRTMSSISFFEGVKKMQRIGHSYEFDQIKRYVQGDDIRNINWKATARVGELMVNHYEEEKAQQVVCIIDKSRTMKMPFHELSLLDYSINSTLTISNIALQKEDRVGLITFSDKIGSTLAPDRHHGQLRKVLEALYNEKERFLEANYELLYLHVRNVIHVRSLLFLFTNFESVYAIQRAVQILRKLNKLHLLVVIFFENSEITDFAGSAAHSVEEIYLTTVAAKFAAEKKLIRQELTKYGIQTIVTTPEELSINTINKYLELKARGLI
ncbi:MAG: DUF58 domain-containing protein [Chitinophagales bacterium]